MIKILRVLLGLLGLVVVVAFAVANRMPVAVSLAPLPIVLELPVYGVFLLGLVLGGAAWRDRALAGRRALSLAGAPSAQPGGGAREPDGGVEEAGADRPHGGLCRGAGEHRAGRSQLAARGAARPATHQALVVDGRRCRS